MPGAICPDCGSVVSGGRDGCRNMFEEIIAREFSDYRYGRVHRLTVDAYSMQHPDAYMRSGKSFAAHLTGVCAAIEFADPHELNRAVQAWASRNPQIDKPDHIPERRGSLTVAYIHSSPDAETHVGRVGEWARDVWNAWAEHHDLARELIRTASASAQTGYSHIQK